MEKKINTGMGVLKVLGLIYLPLGTIFLILGTILGIFVDSLFLLIFAGIGSIFAILGVVFLVIEHRKKCRFRKLLEAGKFFWAEVADVTYNPSVRINGRCPRILVVKHVTPNGEIQLFRSGSITKNCTTDLIGRKVRVYAEEGNLRNYYVDVEPLFQNIVEY